MSVQAGECRLNLAEETAAEMSELLSKLREAMPQTQLVLMAPLPKGEYWPNRCTPAFRVFKEALQVLLHPHALLPERFFHRRCSESAAHWLLRLLSQGLRHP